MSPSRQFRTHNADETIAVGRLLSNFLQPGEMVVLRGDLGAGKTTLVKGIAEGFGAAFEDNVTSPTFTLIHEYRGPQITLFHIDLYRIDTDRELMTLAIDDLRAEPSSILLVEWGDKFEKIVSESGAEIAIERTGDSERLILHR